ncbi:hypothetical protein GCM10010398_49230 [Streptomyces fimbriatus]
MAVGRQSARVRLTRSPTAEGGGGTRPVHGPPSGTAGSGRAAWSKAAGGNPSRAQWRLPRAAVPARPDDLFIAGGPHQRAYDANVSLKSLGTKVTGRSVKLCENHRSTQGTLRRPTAPLVGAGLAAA